MSRYSDIVREHVGSPRNVGEIPDVPFGEAGTQGQGPYMRLWLRVEDGMVADVRFKTYGCPAAIAGGSVLTEMVEGKPVTRCAAFDSGQLLDALGGLPLGKGHCADIAVAALRDALSKIDGRPDKHSAAWSTHGEQMDDGGKTG